MDEDMIEDEKMESKLSIPKFNVQKFKQEFVVKSDIYANKKRVGFKKYGTTDF